MSYGAGAVGLNLQFANYVFLFDRWWNPAVEDQAINRAHRIGASGPTTVTRFLALDTIEERIDRILQEKRELFETIFSGAEGPGKLGLTHDELFGLFSLPGAEAGETRGVTLECGNLFPLSLAAERLWECGEGNLFVQLATDISTPDESPPVLKSGGIMPPHSKLPHRRRRAAARRPDAREARRDAPARCGGLPSRPGDAHARSCETPARSGPARRRAIGRLSTLTTPSV